MTRARWAVAAAAALSLTACGGGDGGAGADAGGEVAGGEITVFAAASLTETFTRLAEDFEAAHPGTDVRVNFAGSSALAQQIGQGAPVDVFASASPAAMRQVRDSVGVAGEATTFARNKIVIAVPRGNPAGITGPADFGRSEPKIALCAEQVPCGAAAREALGAAGVTPRPDTLEQDVRAVLTKVRLGEVDAALVYATDVRAAGGEVEGIAFPEADEAVNDYPIAVLTGAPHAAGARAFVDHVLSDEGRAVLAAAGFAAP